MSEKYLQVLYNVDWPQSGSQTFWTWSEPGLNLILNLGFGDQVQQNAWTQTS